MDNVIHIFNYSRITSTGVTNFSFKRWKINLKRIRIFDLPNLPIRSTQLGIPVSFRINVRFTSRFVHSLYLYIALCRLNVWFKRSHAPFHYAVRTPAAAKWDRDTMRLSPISLSQHVFPSVYMCTDSLIDLLDFIRRCKLCRREVYTNVTRSSKVYRLLYV